MFQTTINPAILEDFKANVHGQVIVPGDDSYNTARHVWNGMIDKYPALIVRCADVSDVVSSVQFAHSHKLAVAVRGGGHSFPGFSTCDDGIVIDLSPMKDVQVDPARRTAWVQAGVTLGECIRETQKSGLIVPVGTTSETGLAGLTLGGGMGWLMGKYGLTIDNLLAVEIVTADGQVIRASTTEHPDLFWGVRGGGGNFGIVTSFEFQLHPVGLLLAGMLIYPLDKAKEMLRFSREVSSTAPDELTIFPAFFTTPEGLPAVGIGLCYCGNLEEGNRAIEPIRKFGSPLADLIRPMPYLELISMLDVFVPRGRCYYSKARSLKSLDDEVLDTLISYGSARPTPLSQIVIQHFHGAAARVDPSETAFALRGEYYDVQTMLSWDENTASEADEYVRWVRALWTAMEPFTTDGTYVNFLGSDERSTAVQAAYGANYERLVALKNTYDPANFFHINQNIKPTLQE